MGGFYSEVALQKREAEGTVRTKHQLNLDPNFFLIFLIVGGLYSVTALRKNKKEGDSVY